jgi:ATP-binding cassette subfamily B protein
MTFPSSFWRLFLDQAKPYWKRFLLLYALSLSSEASLLVMPFMMKGFLNAMASGGKPDEVLRWLGYAAAARLGGFLLGRLQFPIERSVSTKLLVQIESAAVKRILQQDYAFFTDMPSGQILSKIQKFAQSFDRLHFIFLQTYLPAVVNVGFLLVLGLWRAPLIAVATMVFAALSIFFAWYRSRSMKPVDRVITEARSRATGILADILGQAVTVLFFSAQKREEKNYAAVTHDLLQKWRIRWMANWRTMNYQRLVSVGFELAVLVIVFYEWREGSMTVGDVVLYQGMVAMLLTQVRGFFDSIRNWHDATVEAEEGMALLNREPKVKDTPGAKRLQVRKGEIAFDDVDFGYSQKTGVVRDLSFTVHSGERLALVGRSGAGKSTIVKLLMRLYDVDRGAIMIDGQSIQKVTQSSLREAVSYVPQEPLLFHRSILENIRYGKPNATEKEVIAASKKAFCHEFIKKLPNGYDSLVGERGVKLSGGERQRVAIARAILKDAPILVLDEAT